VAGLGPTYGRGAMTNQWRDLKNADVVLVCGANPAENHPASMSHINRARDERGAKLVVVDPRFTRTAATANIYAPLRSGSDIAFWGGLMSYILENDLYHEEYVVNFTNASFLINKGFQGPAELDGYYSGFDAEKRSYDTSTWQYQTDADGKILRDETLQDPYCVFQLLKKHFARYTIDVVENMCGMPRDKFLEVAQAFAATGAPEKTGTILYAMGQTQHTVGTQNVRAMAMLQLLLGNTGRPGGGVNALRGESNVQGSTDMAVLYDIIPAYMATPNAAKHPTLADYLEKETPSGGYWVNKPKFLTSLLKAWWGDYAMKATDFCYDYLPKISGGIDTYSWIAMFHAIYDGAIKGLWVMGQNPAVAGPNARFERKALEKLEWMVIQEIVQTETTEFWKAPDVDPTTIQTEVFLLPAADAMEKEGTIVTSGRLIQYRPKVAVSPGDALSDIEIMDRICQELRRLYTDEGGALPEAMLRLNWSHGADFERICQEINGYYARDVYDNEGALVGQAGQMVANFTKLLDDGSTACGNWIYSGYWVPAPDGDGNTITACKRRGQKDPGGLGMHPYWAFSWPVNRRIIYNRCSADKNGNPWSADKALIWWDAEQKQWTGYDVPDFSKTKAPGDAGFTDAFIMQPEGKGRLFAVRNEGPFPEHYEPLESPVSNLLSSVQVNPVVKQWDMDRGQSVGDNVGASDRFPIICTTYRLVEHWQAGGMSRWLPWLAEAQPETFVEMSPELAREKGVSNGDRVVVSSARGEIEVVALVTPRFKPFTVDGKTVHHVGLPWHYGWQGLATGGTANFLTPHVGDGNTAIPEYKAFLVDIRKAV
jgi:formate dehydrogenase-N alpha subunit